jgi:hypothetical protein
MSMNENLSEPPVEAGVPMPEFPVDAPAVEDVTAAVQGAASSMDAPAPEDLPVQEAVAGATPVEALAAEEAVAIAEAAPVEAPPAFEEPVAAPVEPAAQVAPPAPAAPEAATPAPPAPEAAPPAPPVAPPAPAAPPAPPAPPVMAAAPVTAAAVATFPNGKPMMDVNGRPASPKSRLAAAILAWFLGVIGVHRFYVGKVGTGILMILTLGGLGVWALIDFIVILVGSFKDKQGRVLSNW